MFNFLKNLFGAKKEEAKPVQAEAPYKVEMPVTTYDVAPVVVEGVPAHVVAEGAGIVTTWPFPQDAKPAEGEKKAKVKKARAPKDPAAKKPRAKKAKQ